MNTVKVVNNDTGSVKIPVSWGCVVGSIIQIEGEKKQRTITYLMQSKSADVHVCFKGQGPCPLGEITISKVS